MAEISNDAKNAIPRPGIVFLRPISQPKGVSRKVPKKLTISVSKKVFKTAVLRNRAKRMVREAYRLAVSDINKDSKHDTLHPLPFLRIDAREGVFRMKPEEIRAVIKAELQRQTQ